MNQLNELHKPKTIVLSKQNYERLKKLGSFGESFDDVLTKVLQQITEQDKKWYIFNTNRQECDINSGHQI